MKRLLLAALILFTFSAYSQTYAKIYIWKISPDTVFAGDSITVDFKFDEPQQNPKIDTTFMQVYYGSGFTSYIWKDKWQNIYNYPKKEVGFQDSVYQVRVRIPTNTMVGDCRIYGRGGSYLPFYVKARTTAVILNKTVVKVKETRYYNLLGAELPEALPGVRVIRVIIYEDGSSSSSLVMML